MVLEMDMGPPIGQSGELPERVEQLGADRARLRARVVGVGVHRAALRAELLYERQSLRRARQ